MLKDYTLAYGETELTFSLPAGKVLQVVEGQPAAAVADVPAAVRQALRQPIGALPLAAVVQPGDSVAIIASDITRQWIRHDLFLPVLLDELNAAGIPDRDIVLVVALGAHRHHTAAEHAATYGAAVVQRVRIEQSHAPHEQDFVSFGTTSRGTPVTINRHVAKADKVIMTGGIVYHMMAGFGGGRKSIMPGVSGYASIQANHRLCLHDIPGQGIHPDSRSGNLATNAMHQDMLEMAEMLNPAFILNAVFTPEGQFASFVAGHWQQAWEAGCRQAAAIFGVPITAPTELVIASAGGFPKDINLYQASKTLDNAFQAATPDGVIIVLLECRDILEPPDFSQWFNYTSLAEREMALREAFTVPGFAALKIGIMAAKIPHIVITRPENYDFIRRAGMTPAATPKEALALAGERLRGKDYRITLMPHAANTMPIF